MEPPTIVQTVFANVEATLETMFFLFGTSFNEIVLPSDSPVVEGSGLESTGIVVFAVRGTLVRLEILILPFSFFLFIFDIPFVVLV